MKRILLVNQERITLTLLTFFVITLPLKNNFNSMAIILLSCFSFLLCVFGQKMNVSLLKKFIPIFLFFSVLLLSITYSENTANGFKMIMRSLPFLLLPLIFSVIYINKKSFVNLLWLFILWMALLCLYSHTLVLSKLVINNDNLYNIFNSYYSYQSLSVDTIDLHSTYYAYYVIVAIVFLVSFTFKEKRRAYLILYFLLLAYFTFFVFHLSARTPIFTLFLFYNFSIIYYFVKQKKIRQGVFFLLALYIVTSLVVYNIRITRYRFQHLLGFTYSNNVHHEDGKDKILQWKASLYANNNVLSGNGIGDANQSIFDSYLDFGLQKNADREYNAHNQFIQTYVGLGVVGLLLLLFVFLFYFKEFYKKSFFQGYVLILLTFILFQTESYLERHNGIVMFVFLICFFIYQLENKNALPSTIVASKILNK